MTFIDLMVKKILSKNSITKTEALQLYREPLNELCQKANELRQHFLGNNFDLCTIINGKSGRCSENCKFCAQSAHNHTGANIYPLLSEKEILHYAKECSKSNILRYSIVTSGKFLSDAEVDKMCSAVKMIKEQTNLSVCVSFGLLTEAQFKKLKMAGVSRVHNNLETSEYFFPQICTTHTFADKIFSIKAAQAAGLEVCSGGIMGLGESIEDRIDMALCLRSLEIKSVPINILNPIPGTPFEKNEKLTNEEIQRTIAVFRFILPDAYIRLAGGRILLQDKGEACFLSGANAAISGDMLTTTGTTIQNDLSLIEKLGFQVVKCNE